MCDHVSQLKMVWFTDRPLPELTLPEGYAFSHFSEKNREIDIHDWNECIRTWKESDYKILRRTGLKDQSE